MTAGARTDAPIRGGDRPRMAVFVGGSAGAIEALAVLLSHLSRDLAAPVLLVLHSGERGPSVLPTILDRLGNLHAVAPVDGETLLDGVVYVAPRGSHMLVGDGVVQLGNGPAEHGLRPAIDTLFRSAARAYGPRAIGVILSGMLDDGTAGLGEIRERGGWALVQAPDEAGFASMPESAIAHVSVDAVAPAAELATRIAQLVADATLRGPIADDERPRTAVPAVAFDGPEPSGMRTDVTCPRCGGVLWEEVRGELTLYRCRSGHVYSADSLLAMQGEGLETAIWKPVRMLHERGALLHRLARRAAGQGRERSARFFQEQADEALRSAAQMRTAIGVEPDDADGGPGEPT